MRDSPTLKSWAFLLPLSMDSISLQRLNALHTKLRDKTIQDYNAIQALLPATDILRATRTYATFDYQNSLYAIGRTEDGKIITNARGGESLHNYGFAIDYVIIRNGKLTWDIKDPSWQILINKMLEFGYEWGGNWKHFKDNPHFEYTYDYSWKQLLALYNDGKTFVDGGNVYVEI